MEFTRATIAKVNDNQSVTAIELHYYGSKEEAGEILAEHYTTAEQVDALLAGGDLMSLDPQQAGCSYVHIEMSADWEDCQPTTYRTLGHFLGERSNVDFLYIFHQNRWNYLDCNE